MVTCNVVKERSVFPAARQQLPVCYGHGAAGMNDLRDLFINLAAAGIAFVAGYIARGTLLLVKRRTPRRFWRSIAASETIVILGSFSQFARFEPTGLTGTGDARAFHELLSYFDKLGIRHVGVAYSGSLSDGQLNKSLVILGGGDSNRVHLDIMGRIPVAFEMLDNSMGFVDSQSGELFRPQMTDGRVVYDFGAITRVSNPFNPDYVTVVIAGSFGYATWAGARLVQDRSFLKACRKYDEFSCLYRVEVAQNIPQRVVPLQWRSIVRNLD